MRRAAASAQSSPPSTSRLRGAAVNPLPYRRWQWHRER